MEVLLSIVGKIGECLVEPIGCQFGYFIHYHSNIETFKEQVQVLKVVRKDVEESTTAAKRNGEVAKNEVQNWTSRVDGALSEATKLLQGVEEVKFLDLISRYQLGRKTAKKTTAIKELKKDGEFDQVTNPAPPPGVLSMPSQDFVIFESTKNYMEIMEALKDDRTNFIVIHGMGGVGKTSLVKEIAKSVEQDKHFDAIVMVVVSQTINVIRIQDQIAEMLGLDLKQIRTKEGRASWEPLRGKDLEEWKEVALKLKKAEPVNIEGVNDDVYKCLKLSYDYLRNKEDKFIFQFCCLFPKDYDIPMEDLERYGIGLRTFEDVRIQEARNRARSIVNNLKESCLLLMIVMTFLLSHYAEIVSF
ncbi:hypothetical protein GH714_012957 [Hevea brasiliensis]|uniref:NB-ARC domain-containing protein n=1 Tax=Hevea brasiliensis TaxID=3981 RepID=A0A6A6N394_HEVBR|nr:hypothetical protein GH714_012957 [Hevea brasiliensis]